MSTCNYILKKGKNKGEKCGIKCSSDSLLCKKHSVNETTDDAKSDINNNSSDDSVNDINKVTDNTKKDKQATNADITAFFKKPAVAKETKKKELKSEEMKEKKEETKNAKNTKTTKTSKEKGTKGKKEIKETGIQVQVYERQRIQAKRNKYGNYVLDNNLVVHPVSKIIIGRQDLDKVIDISIEDIEYCKEHGFRYEPPSIMYFADSEYEKKEVTMQTEMFKSSKKTNDDNDILEQDEELDEEDLDEEDEDSDNEL